MLRVSGSTKPLCVYARTTNVEKGGCKQSRAISFAEDLSVPCLFHRPGSLKPSLPRPLAAAHLPLPPPPQSPPQGPPPVGLHVHPWADHHRRFGIHHPFKDYVDNVNSLVRNNGSEGCILAIAREQSLHVYDKTTTYVYAKQCYC